jgi:hypothetical protein
MTLFLSGTMSAGRVDPSETADGQLSRSGYFRREAQQAMRRPSAARTPAWYCSYPLSPSRSTGTHLTGLSDEESRREARDLPISMYKV